MKMCKVVFNIKDGFVSKLTREREVGIKIFTRGETEPVSRGEREYTYETTLTDLRLGDRLVVEQNNTYTIVTFVGYTNIIPEGVTLNKVVDVIDFSSYQNAIEREIKLREIKAKMEERRKGLEELTIFKMLATEDEDMKEMLKEYTELMKGE